MQRQIGGMRRVRGVRKLSGNIILLVPQPIITTATDDLSRPLASGQIIRFPASSPTETRDQQGLERTVWDLFHTWLDAIERSLKDQKLRKRESGLRRAFERNEAQFPHLPAHRPLM